jgi:hypothetical protein
MRAVTEVVWHIIFKLSCDALRLHHPSELNQNAVIWHGHKSKDFAPPSPHWKALSPLGIAALWALPLMPKMADPDCRS